MSFFHEGFEKPRSLFIVMVAIKIINNFFYLQKNLLQEYLVDFGCFQLQIKMLERLMEKINQFFNIMV
jgi:hypothetical protein